MSALNKIIASLACLMLLALGLQQAFAQPVTFAPLVKRQRGKVVHISTSNKLQHGRPGRLRPFRFPEFRQGMGSGFLISPGGLIVTNHHVIADSQGIEVVLASGEKYPATVVGVDAHTDLALIKIDGKNLPAVQFGDSEAIEVGDWVLAIGNPLGLDYSVTAGSVSAKGRNIFDSDNIAYGEFIQTDAAINPGNSGGPLFNLKGQVIGVNTAISSRGHGIGFAVPSNLVVEVIRQLRLHGKVRRGWLGVVIQEVTPEMAKALGLSGRAGGVLVEESLPEGPAAAAGIRQGDVLTQFAGQPLLKVPQLQKLVAFSAPGRLVKLAGIRRRQDGERRGRAGAGWKAVRFAVRIGRPPGEREQAGGPMMERLGLTVTAPSPGLRRSLGLRPGVGVLVDAVIPHGLAAATGLRKGDIILEVDRQEVGSREDIGKILGRARGGRISMVVRRDRQVLYLVLSFREP